MHGYLARVLYRFGPGTNLETSAQHRIRCAGLQAAFAERQDQQLAF